MNRVFETFDEIFMVVTKNKSKTCPKLCKVVDGKFFLSLEEANKFLSNLQKSYYEEHNLDCFTIICVQIDKVFEFESTEQIRRHLKQETKL